MGNERQQLATGTGSSRRRLPDGCIWTSLLGDMKVEGSAQRRQSRGTNAGLQPKDRVGKLKRQPDAAGPVMKMRRGDVRCRNGLSTDGDIRDSHERIGGKGCRLHGVEAHFHDVFARPQGDIGTEGEKTGVARLDHGEPVAVVGHDVSLRQGTPRPFADVCVDSPFARIAKRGLVLYGRCLLGLNPPVASSPSHGPPEGSWKPLYRLGTYEITSYAICQQGTILSQE